MNKDQIKGVAKDIAGKAQETTGQLLGNEDQQAKGVAKQIEGKGEKAFGDAKEVVKSVIDKI
jgi:uncharacterized protein YjbJ (UPF0337 family)